MYKDINTLEKHPREYWEVNIHRWVYDELARKILTRNLLDGIPYEQIAEELQISRATVYNKMRKYSKQLFIHCD